MFKGILLGLLLFLRAQGGMMPGPGTPHLSGGGGCTLPATDSFTRANASTLGANWNQSSVLVGIVSNSAQLQSYDGEGYAWYGGGCTFTATQYAEVVGTGMSSDSRNVGLLLRATDANNYYYAEVQNGSWSWSRKVAGTTHFINSSGSAADGDTICLQMSGTTLSGFTNHVMTWTTTDSSLAGPGAPGIIMTTSGADGASPAMTNFQGGNGGCP